MIDFFQEVLKQQEENNKLLKDINEKINPDQEVWDIFNVCENWNVSKRTIMNWKSKGLIGFSQIGNKIYFSKKDRDEFMKNHHFNPIKNYTNDN